MKPAGVTDPRPGRPSTKNLSPPALLHSARGRTHAAHSGGRGPASPAIRRPRNGAARNLVFTSSAMVQPQRHLERHRDCRDDEREADGPTEVQITAHPAEMDPGE